MEMTEYDHGVPSWVDLGTSDPGAAAEFYAGLFGWTSEEGPPEAGGYRMCLLRGKPVAGLGPQMNPGPPWWSTYVSVDDADAAVAVTAENGGQVIVPPMDVLDVGRMAVVMDPVGAVVSVWQPRAHKGAALVNEPGTLCWNELITTDIDRSKAFYSKLFGWGAVTHGEGATAYTEFQVKDRSIAGMMLKPPMMPAEVPPNWGVYFMVEDTDAAAARAVELGGTQVTPAMDIEPGRFAVLSDPTGAVFSVITMKPAT
jgi:predicted enzyme related to lactoylglutathione lyase